MIAQTESEVDNPWRTPADGFVGADAVNPGGEAGVDAIKQRAEQETQAIQLEEYWQGRESQQQQQQQSP